MIVTTENVITALCAWKAANAIARDAHRLPSVTQEELDRLWQIEENLLNKYTDLYNIYWAQPECTYTIADYLVDYGTAQ